MYDTIGFMHIYILQNHAHNQLRHLSPQEARPLRFHSTYWALRSTECFSLFLPSSFSISSLSPVPWTCPSQPVSAFTIPTWGITVTRITGASETQEVCHLRRTLPEPSARVPRALCNPGPLPPRRMRRTGLGTAQGPHWVLLLAGAFAWAALCCWATSPARCGSPAWGPGSVSPCSIVLPPADLGLVTCCLSLHASEAQI